MLGWVAATNNFGIEAGTLFLIQFFWQFPHFWAIGWFLYEDYEKAGFYMLPTGKKDTSTALQTILYSIWLLIASLLPCLGYTGKLFLSPNAAGIVFLFRTLDDFLCCKIISIEDSQSGKNINVG